MKRRNIMAKMKVCYLITIVILFCSTIAMCDNQYFEFEEEFANWFTYYYLSPEPEKIPSAIKYYCESSMFEKTNARMPMAAFFTALFRKDSELMEKSYDVISLTGDENTKIFILNALWLVNTEKSHGLIEKAKSEWTSEAIQDIIARMNAKSPYDILTVPITAARLDMLWTTFLATGDSAPVKRIISVMHLVENGSGFEIAIGGAARWSLDSNARQHKRVYDICKEEMEQSEGKTKELLKEIIESIEQEPAQ